MLDNEEKNDISLLIKSKLLHKIKNYEKKVSKCNDFKDYILNDDLISRHFLIKTIEELNKSYTSFKIDFCEETYKHFKQQNEDYFNDNKFSYLSNGIRKYINKERKRKREHNTLIRWYDKNDRSKILPNRVKTDLPIFKYKCIYLLSQEDSASDIISWLYCGFVVCLK